MPETLDEIRAEQKAVFAAIGEATTNWIMVESAMCGVFVRVLASGNRDAASAAFHSAINFNTKLAMLDAAAAFAVTDEALSTEWNSLANKINRAAKRRNSLAHLALYTDLTGKHAVVFLGPPLTDARNPVEAISENPKFTLKRVSDIAFSFRLLLDRINAFEQSLSAR